MTPTSLASHHGRSRHCSHGHDDWYLSDEASRRASCALRVPCCAADGLESGGAVLPAARGVVEQKQAGEREELAGEGEESRSWTSSRSRGMACIPSFSTRPNRASGRASRRQPHPPVPMQASLWTASALQLSPVPHNMACNWKIALPGLIHMGRHVAPVGGLELVLPAVALSVVIVACFLSPCLPATPAAQGDMNTATDTAVALALPLCICISNIQLSCRGDAHVVLELASFGRRQPDARCLWLSYVHAICSCERGPKTLYPNGVAMHGYSHNTDTPSLTHAHTPSLFASPFLLPLSPNSSRAYCTLVLFSKRSRRTLEG